MGAYVRKKAALVVWAKIAFYASSVKRIRSAGRIFFLMSLLSVGSPRRRTGEET